MLLLLTRYTISTFDFRWSNARETEDNDFERKKNGTLDETAQVWKIVRILKYGRKTGFSQRDTCVILSLADAQSTSEHILLLSVDALCYFVFNRLLPTSGTEHCQVSSGASTPVVLWVDRWGGRACIFGLQRQYLCSKWMHVVKQGRRTYTFSMGGGLHF